MQDGWRHFSATLAGAGAAIFLALFTAIVAADPYDTGRLALLTTKGVPQQAPGTANASRGRDPSFNAAIFGNSSAQILSPERLDRATGSGFVSLIVPGTGPSEHLVLIDYFLRHRASPPRALVIGIDPNWCAPRLDLPNMGPFPRWLYSEHLPTYLAGLVRYGMLERVWMRLAYALGRARPAPPDGYWDYESGYLSIGYGERVAERLSKLAPVMPYNPKAHFPFLDRLGAQIARLPPETAVVLVRPPVYHTALPRPGEPDGVTNTACLAALTRLVAGRSLSGVVDWLVERPENRTPEYFFDYTHYRTPVARLIEQDIAAVIRAGRGGSAASH